MLQTEAALCCAAWKLKGQEAWHWPSDALRQAALHIERQLPDQSALWHNRSLVLTGCTAHSNCDLVLPPASILPVLHWPGGSDKLQKRCWLANEAATQRLHLSCTCVECTMFCLGRSPVWRYERKPGSLVIHGGRSPIDNRVITG